MVTENGCRYKEKCAYRHQVNKQTKKQNELKEKVTVPERSVFEMTNKLVNMETEQLKQLEKLNMLEK